MQGVDELRKRSLPPDFVRDHFAATEAGRNSRDISYCDHGPAVSAQGALNWARRLPWPIREVGTEWGSLSLARGVECWAAFTGVRASGECAPLCVGEEQFAAEAGQADAAWAVGDRVVRGAAPGLCR